MKIKVDFSDLKKRIDEMAKKKKDKFQLTPRGLLGDEIHDKLLLYMYKTEHNAIVIVDENLSFEKVEKRKK